MPLPPHRTFLPVCGLQVWVRLPNILSENKWPYVNFSGGGVSSKSMNLIPPVISVSCSESLTFTGSLSHRKDSDQVKNRLKTLIMSHLTSLKEVLSSLSVYLSILLESVRGGQDGVSLWCSQNLINPKVRGFLLTLLG